MFQQMIIKELVTGRYYNQHNKLYSCAYFVQLLRRAKSCTQLLADEGICNYIARYFSTIYEDAWMPKL